MIKSKTVLHHKIGDRDYNLEVSPDSPLGELHDALVAMKNFVIQKMQEVEQKPVSCDESNKQCQNCE